MGTILFDPRSTYYYVSEFCLGFYMICNVLDIPILVSTTIGESVVVIHVYRAYSVLFIRFQTWVNLVILDIINFDVF